VSSTTRSSPPGRSPSQDTESTQLRKAPPETRASLDDVMGANRKPLPNTQASGDNVRGGATTKELVGTGNAIVFDSPMAAAASTLLYQLQYGGDDGKYASDHSDTLDDLCASLDDDKDYMPNGLVFSDDEDFLIDINYESEDEQLRSSFPKNKLQMNIIPGGPEPPNLSKYPESERDAVLAAYLIKRKAFTNRDCHRRVKKSKLEAKLSGTVSGAQIEQLHPMSKVETHLLLEGDTFKNKEVLQIRISKKANLRGISTRAHRSDLMNLILVGINFYVNALFFEHSGWVVHTAICRECDDVLQIPPKYRIDPSMTEMKKGFLRIPIKAKFVIAIIKDAVADSPGISYQSIQEMMKPYYAKEYTLTDSIVQDARDKAKLQLFGSAEENVHYAWGVVDQVRELGHEVEMIFQDRWETLQLVSSVMLHEDLMRWKKMKLPALDKLCN
jgi:hypothetical protein